MAIAVFSVIAVGIMGAIYSGMRLWGRARTVDFSKGHSLLAIESFTSELRQSVSVSSDYLDSAVFEGDSQTISFPAVVNSGLFEISYRFDAERKALVRRALKFEDILAGKKDNYTEKDVLELEELSFAYLDKDKEQYTWHNEWTKDKGAPSAVRLQCRIKDEEYTKIVLIPIS